MKKFRKKFPKPPSPQEVATQTRQRRMAKVVHDERGSASVEWRDAPEGFDRPALEVEDAAITRNAKVRGGIEVLHIKNDDSFDPYERQPEDRKKDAHAGKRDLRKLSEYIKMMRELEERKKRDESGE